MITHQPPHIHSSDSKESSSDYLQRVSSVYPNIPPDILENWAWRHWEAFRSAYDNLSLGNCDFKLEMWSKYRITKIEAISNSDIAEWGKLFTENSYWRGTWLAQYIIREKTWPVPIIVLDNFLLEGHRRLGYLNTLIKTDFSVAEYHPVCVCYRTHRKEFLH